MSIVLTIGAGGAWHFIKKQWAITGFTVSGLSVSAQGVALRHLAIAQAVLESERTLTLEDVRLSRKTLKVGTLRLNLPTSPKTDAVYALPDDLTQFIPTLAPKQLIIETLVLEVPCHSQRCTLTGALSAQVISNNLLAQLALDHHDQLIEATLNAQLNPVGPMQLEVRLNQTPKAVLRNDLVQTDWQGSASLKPIPEITWLLPLLANWLPALHTLPSLPQADIQAAWNIQALRTFDLAAIEEANIDFAMQLAEPWMIANVGTLSGTTAFSVTRQTKKWHVRNINANLTLANLAWAWPEAYKPSTVAVTLAPREDELFSANAAVTLTGPIQATLTGPAQFDAINRALILNQAALELTSPHLKLAALTLTNASVQGFADLLISPSTSSLTSSAPWQLSAKTLNLPEIKAQDVALTLTPEKLLLAFANSALSYQGTGKFALNAQALKHSLLQPSAWHWRGTWQLAPMLLTLDAQLNNVHGLKLQHRLSYPFTQQAELGFSTHIDLATQNLAQSFSVWPKELELNTGKIAAEGTLEFPPFTLNLKGSATGASGIYSTSEFTDLNAPFSLKINNNRLSFKSHTLTLNRLNSGIGLGPLTANAQFDAALGKLAQGRLAITHLNGAFLGGTLTIDDQLLDLAKPKPVVVLAKGVEIAELLTAYPAEGLAGTGTLDARLPLLLSKEGISIEQGHLAARSPGGHLAFTSAKLSALGKSNPAMKIAADALENFHYHTLTSGVQLSPAGRLNLAFNLAGQNPDVEKGRPINFTINLQEDLPALFKSLQLSGKVSERIEHKVRQQLNQSTGTDSAR